MTDSQPEGRDPPRVVCWFSCGAASAVATKLALEKYRPLGAEIAVVYCDTRSEHPDNARFLIDCEWWFEQPVVRLGSKRYHDIWAVFKERRYLNGPKGALCTTEMKKMLRYEFQRPDDIQVFGYTPEEQRRADRFRSQNFEVTLETPLIDQGVTKTECLRRLREAGIELPAMYQLGYRNNNCIGCVKGGAGYWNKIRQDFPEVFARMAAQERELGVSLIRVKGQRVFLDELDPEAGRYEPLEEMDCGLLCGVEENANV